MVCRITDLYFDIDIGKRDWSVRIWPETAEMLLHNQVQYQSSHLSDISTRDL